MNHELSAVMLVAMLEMTLLLNLLFVYGSGRCCCYGGDVDEKTRKRERSVRVVAVCKQVKSFVYVGVINHSISHRRVYRYYYNK